MKPFRLSLLVCAVIITAWFSGFYVGRNESISERRQPPKIITEIVGTNAFSYMRPSPSRKLINGTQDRYIDWPYPPLRTNMCLYFADREGIAYLYLCNDGQVRWEFKEAKP